MNFEVILGVIMPFFGTTLGSACVFLLRGAMPDKLQKAMLGFASGVMVAASFWSLLIPSMELSAPMGNLAFVPAVAGFLLGMGFLLLMDKVIPHLHLDSPHPEGVKSNLGKSSMLMLAVTLHNVPEGAAVGIVLAGAMAQTGGLGVGQLLTLAGALALSVGIAIQNFPEGAIISLPLRDELGKGKAFLYGALSGIVEPLAALLTIFVAAFVEPILPYMLSFAAGAMLYVVVEELIPESAEGKHSNLSTVGFALGFVLMLILDVTLG
ncbi:MAG: ZIP family metal transporter [Lachnospiraceae bacterium]|nr:ZIP family metal transporter [Lachnospiraceae bacterium]